MTITRLEDGDFLIKIDCDLRSLAERKMFVATDAEGRPKTPELVPMIVKIGRGQKILEGLLSGTYKSLTDACDVMGFAKATGSRNLRMATLSPVIVERIVTGRLNLEKLAEKLDRLITVPLWYDQHKLLGID